MSFSVVGSVEHLKREYRSFITSSYRFADDALRQRFDTQVNETDMLAKGPYVTLARDFETGRPSAALVDAGADGRTLVIANAPEADAPRLFDLSRQRGLRVDLTIALTPPEGRPATAWTAADWAALRRTNDTILAAAHG